MEVPGRTAAKAPRSSSGRNAAGAGLHWQGKAGFFNAEPRVLF